MRLASLNMYLKNLQIMLLQFGRILFDELCIEEFSLMYKVKDDWVAFHLARVVCILSKFDIKTKAQSITTCL